MEVEVWRKLANLDFRRRASTLVLQMALTARDACMAMGGDKLLEPNDGVRALQVMLLRAGRPGCRPQLRAEVPQTQEDHQAHGRELGQVWSFAR